MPLRSVLGGMAAICLVLAGCKAPPAPPAAEPLVDDGGRIMGLYRALEALDGGRARAPVVMLQIGDSHTETDGFSGRMRELLQARFGDGGRGPLPPGVPTRWYRPQQVAVSASPGWRMAGARPGPVAGMVGMTGVSATAETADAVMTLVATGAAGFDAASVEVVAQPGGGTLEARVDDGPPFPIATAGEAAKAAWHDIPVPAGGRTLTLRAGGDGPASLLMWSVARAVPGIVYANLGIVGATVGVLDRWDPGAVATEAARLRPALLLVAFGTNEGFDATLDGAAYRAGFAARLAGLRAAMPGAAIVVLGPPDGNQAVRRRGRRPVATGCSADGGGNAGWTVPRNLAVVREAQRSVAEEHGWLFWDWAAAMGGACSIDGWVRADPPLAWPDHVHLREAGYRDMAEALFAELMRGYAAYRARTPPA